MNFSEIFIRRPIATSLLMAAIALFGVVGYRDSKDATPAGYEYTARVFARPDFTQPPEAALTAMRDLAATTSGNDGFDEDPVAGVATALDEIDWGPLGGRYLVLITDAGGREAADPLSTTRQGIGKDQMLGIAASLRRLGQK